MSTLSGISSMSASSSGISSSSSSSSTATSELELTSIALDILRQTNEELAASKSQHLQFARKVICAAVSSATEKLLMEKNALYHLGYHYKYARFFNNKAASLAISKFGVADSVIKTQVASLKCADLGLKHLILYCTDLRVSIAPPESPIKTHAIILLGVSVKEIFEVRRTIRLTNYTDKAYQMFPLDNDSINTILSQLGYGVVLDPILDIAFQVKDYSTSESAEIFCKEIFQTQRKFLGKISENHYDMENQRQLQKIKDDAEAIYKMAMEEIDKTTTSISTTVTTRTPESTPMSAPTTTSVPEAIKKRPIPTSDSRCVIL